MYNKTVLLQTTFLECLNPTEDEWLEKYETLTQNSVVMLGQNPHKMPVYSGMSGHLQTIVRNCHPLWSQKHDRWFVPNELAQVHGWPVYSNIYGEKCTLSMDRSSMGLPPRRRREVFHQIGNGMFVFARLASRSFGTTCSPTDWIADPCSTKVFSVDLP